MYCWDLVFATTPSCLPDSTGELEALLYGARSGCHARLMANTPLMSISDLVSDPRSDSIWDPLNLFDTGSKGNLSKSFNFQCENRK